MIDSDAVHVDVTPYRSKDGALLLYVINTRAEPVNASIGFRDDLANPAKNTDWIHEGNYWRREIQLPGLHSRVYRMEK